MNTCHRFALLLTLTLLLSPVAFAADVVIENSGTFTETSLGATDLGQTFTATKTGVLKDIQVAADGVGVVGIATLYIYNGNSSSASLLHSQTVDFRSVDTITSTSNYTFHTITLNSTVNINDGSPYLFLFRSAPNLDLAYQSTDGYVYGDLYSDDNGGVVVGADMIFKVTQADADFAPPVVSSITKSGTPTDNAASITYVVAFNESVSNVSTDDFQVTTASGTATGSVSAVSAATGTSINVTVNSISGTGSIRLDLKENTDITDASGNGNNNNGSVAAYSSGVTHTVDRDAPAAPSVPNLAAVADSGSSSTDNITNDNTPRFLGSTEVGATVTLFSSISGLIATTTANGAGNWLVDVSALTDTVHSITATATDAAGNVSIASVGLSVTIDTTTPVVTSIGVSGSPVATAAGVDFIVNFDESVNNISTDDFTLSATGSAVGTIASVSASSGSSVTVSVVSISGDGSIKLNLNSSTNIADTAGNAGPAAFTSGTTHTVVSPVVPDAPTIGYSR
jgi:hypothetical protein